MCSSPPFPSSEGVLWLPRDRRAPKLARDYIRAVCERLSMGDEAAYDVMLTVCELVTNAFRHANGPIRMEWSAVEGRILAVDVIDGLENKPTFAGHQPASDAESGRGLHIARRCADSLACGSLLEGGKYIRATFALPGAVTQPTISTLPTG